MDSRTGEPRRIGHFELHDVLGEGGMGRVYRATDSRLGRSVAIKVLPESLAHDSSRMARLEREARLLATLNHPNIATIHGIEESEGRKAIVMELVPGEDLSARIARGPIPVAEALDIAIQVARALEAAHLKGVIHRDLKPGNIKLTPDGQVKVLDFGLARTADSGDSESVELTHSPTLSLQATQAGVILGTASYMSPEQARGRAVDARSDIFSFGCVLFEMLSGEPAFGGEDLSEILASVIKRDIRWDRFPATIPAPLRKVVTRCLEGRLDERYQAIGDVRYDLAAFVADPALLDPPTPTTAIGSTGTRRRASPLLLGFTAAVMFTTGALIGGAPWKESDVAPPEAVAFRLEEEASSVRVSPDGRRLAYLSGSDLRVRELDSVTPRTLPLPWTANPIGWALDSRTLILSRENGPAEELWRLSVDASEPALVAVLPQKGFIWGEVVPLDDERLLVSMADGGLLAVPLSGGTPEVLLEPGEREALVGARGVPGRDALLFAEGHSGRIEVLEGGRRRVLLTLPESRIFDPIPLPSGHLLFRVASGRNPSGNYAVPFSAERLEVTGKPLRVLPYGFVSASRTGTIAVGEIVSDETPRVPVWVDRTGQVGPSVGEPLPGLRTPALSPDGLRIAAAYLGPDGDHDICIIDTRNGARMPLRDEVGSDSQPYWLDGGRTIGYQTSTAGVRHLSERAADGSGTIRHISDRAIRVRSSRDGRYQVTMYLVLQYMERGKPDRHLLLEDDIRWFDLSPNCRYITHTPAELPGLFLRRFPEATDPVALTTARVAAPQFSPDGRELFFWQGDSLMVMPLDTTSEFPTPGAPRLLFTASSRRLSTFNNYEALPDGRFLMLQAVEGAVRPETPHPLVVRNFTPRVSG